MNCEDDFDRLVESVCALITTNKEIWARCLPNKISNTTTAAVANELHFYRVGYLAIQVKKSSATGNVVNFTTTSALSTREFLKLPVLPMVLYEIFPIEKGDGLLDYDQYLEKAAWLQESIAILFLAILKEHLKAIQVALGEIESWLLKPSNALAFINDIPVSERYFGPRTWGWLFYKHLQHYSRHKRYLR